MEYVFHAGATDIVDSFWVPNRSQVLPLPHNTLPIIYDSANPANHVVASTTVSPHAARSSEAVVLLLLGSPFAAFAIGTELSVRRQMSLARTGIRTMGSVLGLGQELRVHTHRRRPPTREVVLVIEYEYVTAAGGHFMGRAEVAAAFRPEFETHWPEVIYDPECPSRHLRLEQMWAVNWRGES